MFRHGASLLFAVPSAVGAFAVSSIRGNLTLHPTVENHTVPSAAGFSPSPWANKGALFADLSKSYCKDLPTLTTPASLAYPTEWLSPFDTLYAFPVDAACLSAITASTASVMSSSCKKISSSLSVDPLPSPESDFINHYTTFSANDAPCASSWYTWLSEYGVKSNWDQLERWCTKRTSTIINTYPITSAATTTLCDGIKRVSYETLGYTTETYLIDDFWRLDGSVVNSIGLGYTLGSRSASVKKEYARIRPPPLCRLEHQDCENGWKAVVDKNQFHDLVPKAFHGIELFGCAPPSTECRVLGCGFGAAEFKLIYFDPGVTSSDLCGNDGHGMYYTRPTEQGPPQVQTISAITFEKDHNRAYAEEKQVLQGPYTFTSGNFYLAYVGLQAMDACSMVGRTIFASGVIRVPVSQLTTGLVRPESATWSGSDLDIAKSVAAGKLELPMHQYISKNNVSWEITSRALNVADLQGPIPAANYFMQPDLQRLQRNRSVIIEGNYQYVFAMPATLLELEPAWAECNTDGWIRDPPMVLSTTTRRSPPPPFWASFPGAGAGHGAAGGMVLSTTTRHVPAAPFWAQSPGNQIETRLRVSQAQATPGQTIAAATPTATANAPIATITMHAQAFSKDGTPVGTIEVVMDGEVAPGGRVVLDDNVQAPAVHTGRLGLADGFGRQGFAVNGAPDAESAVHPQPSAIGTLAGPPAVAQYTDTGYASYKTPGYAAQPYADQSANPQEGQGQQNAAGAPDIAGDLSQLASSTTGKRPFPLPSQNTKVQPTIVSTSSKSGAMRSTRAKTFPWHAFVRIWRGVFGGQSRVIM